MGSLLGTDAATGGFLLGGIITATFIIIFMILASKLEATSANPMLIITAFGMIVSVLFGWWPLWTMFIVVIVFAWLVFKPMGNPNAQ